MASPDYAVQFPFAEFEDGNELFEREYETPRHRAGDHREGVRHDSRGFRSDLQQHCARDDVLSQ